MQLQIENITDIIKSYSECLVSELNTRDELHYDMEVKKRFVTLLNDVQERKRRASASSLKLSINNDIDISCMIYKPDIGELNSAAMALHRNRVAAVEVALHNITTGCDDVNDSSIHCDAINNNINTDDDISVVSDSHSSHSVNAVSIFILNRIFCAITFWKNLAALKAVLPTLLV